MDFKVIKISLGKTQKPPVPKIFFDESKKVNKSKSTLRFLKNKNIIQANKQNIEVNCLLVNQKLDNDASSKISRKNSINGCPRSIRTQRSSFRTEERASFLPNNQRSSIFCPQMKEEIIKRHQNQKGLSRANRSHNNSKFNIVPPEEKKPNLQKLLAKYNISGNRCLMGKNIPKIQQQYSFSRFQLFTLYTYYKTLLEASKRSVKQLKRGFESIMYINKIELNSQMIEQMFVEFFKQISFDNFMKVYGNIQNLLFTQNIIEYLITVFSDFYKQEYISGSKILEALKDKLDEGESLEIKKMLYQFYNRRESEDMIQVKEILNACSQSPAICRRVFNGMSKQPGEKEIPKEVVDKK